MRKIPNFCGIFATLFVTTTIIGLVSCSQDDDFYENNEMYTLAEEMGTRSGGGDPGGQPSPAIIHVTDSITEFHELCFYANSVFNSFDFQHSLLVAIDPSLYGVHIEVDATVYLGRVDNIPTVTSYMASPGQYCNSVGMLEPLPGSDFEVTGIYLQLDESTPLPGRYILYATGNHYIDDEIVPCTAFIPNRIYN
ncbi:MAG: hypothetical protein J6T38_06730 [Bacteroidaceae bacterium]|nr:hypothetical protein [Bacteroidaceae bacterium]